MCVCEPLTGCPEGFEEHVDGDAGDTDDHASDVHSTQTLLLPPQRRDGEDDNLLPRKGRRRRRGGFTFAILQHREELSLFPSSEES